jgi:hypothetical protein
MRKEMKLFSSLGEEIIFGRRAPGNELWPVSLTEDDRSIEHRHNGRPAGRPAEVGFDKIKANY